MKYYQGDIYWAKMISDTNNEIAHPNVIIQNEILANSRLDNVIVCGISTNMKRANEIGNVRLKKGDGNLEKESIVVVGQISTIKKNDLGEYIGRLSKERVEEILNGIKQQENIRGR